MPASHADTSEEADGRRSFELNAMVDAGGQADMDADGARRAGVVNLTGEVHEREGEHREDSEHNSASDGSEPPSVDSVDAIFAADLEMGNGDEHSTASDYLETDSMRIKKRNISGGRTRYAYRRQRFHNQFFALLLKNMNLQKRAIFTNIFLVALPALAILNVVGLQMLIRYAMPDFGTDENRNPRSYLSYDYLEHRELPYTDSTASHGEFDMYLRGGFKAMYGMLGDKFFQKSDMDYYLYHRYYDVGKFPIASAYDLHALNFTPGYTEFSHSVYYNLSLGEGRDDSLGDNRNPYVAQNQMAMAYIYSRLEWECKNGHLVNSSQLCTETALKNASEIRIGRKDFPTRKEKVEFDVVAIMQVFFFTLMFHFLCPVIVSSIVHEKENQLIEHMRMMGLRTAAYYIVHYFFYYVIHLSMVVVLMAAGWAAGLRLFTQTDLIHSLLFWVLWGHTLIGYSVFFAAFFGRSRTAFLVVFLLVFVLTIVAWIVNLVEYDMNPLLRMLFSLCPTFTFNWMLILISFMTAMGQAGVHVSDFGKGMESFGDFTRSYEAQLIFFFVDGIYLFVLGLYLQAVLPKSVGVRRSPFFPIKSVYRAFRRGRVSSFNPHHFHSEKDATRFPDDVEGERQRVLHSDCAVQVHAINKRYRGSSKPAIMKLTLGVDKGECFGLLGPNGAGKTTLISILAGMHGPTRGTALVGGYDIRKDMNRIHGLMGVCPQHNILWPELTGSETLKFYGRIRGLRGKRLRRMVNGLMEDVDLTHKGYKRMCVRNYSGGMKRRLSVAVALVGNPDIVYLDEPTTGMDPDAKRGIWRVITEASKDRAVILTTHSMEEADALCRRIGIMAHGELQCIGEKTELKARYGKGYRFTIHVKKGFAKEPAQRFAFELFEGHVTELDRLGGNIVYEVPREEVDLSKVFEAMELRKDEVDIDVWSISATTLDEVFVRITEEAKTSDE